MSTENQTPATETPATMSEAAATLLETWRDALDRQVADLRVRGREDAVLLVCEDGFTIAPGRWFAAFIAPIHPELAAAAPLPPGQARALVATPAGLELTTFHARERAPATPAAAALLEAFRPGIERMVADLTARGLHDSVLLIEEAQVTPVGRTWLAGFFARFSPEHARVLDLSGPLPAGQIWTLVVTAAWTELVVCTVRPLAPAAATIPPFAVVSTATGAGEPLPAVLSREALQLFTSCREGIDKLAHDLAGKGWLWSNLVFFVDAEGSFTAVPRTFAAKLLRGMHPALADEMSKAAQVKTGVRVILETSGGVESFTFFPKLPPRPAKSGPAPAN